MKISLIVPNYMSSRTFLQPAVELYTSAKLLENAGHSVNVYDFRTLKNTAREAATAIDDDTNLIIVSVSPYDMTQMYHMDYRYQYVEYFTKIIKESHPDTYIFGEGAQCTLQPEVFIANSTADGVILWELERTLCELVEAISKGKGVYDVPNLVLKNNDRYEKTIYREDFAHPNPKFFDIIPDWNFADFSKYYGYDLKKEKHSKINYWGVILGSRGCKFNCVFCFNFYKNHIRYRSVHSIVEEVQYLGSLGVKQIFFLDMTFTQNRSWTIDLCNALISIRNRIPWLCQTRCDCIDEELVLLMKSAGCCGIEFGIESFDDDNLEKLNKNIKIDDILHSFELCNKNGVLISAFLMVGTPFESAESINKTIKMLIEKRISFIPIIYTPRIGSVLGDKIACENNAHEWKKLLELRGRLSPKYKIEELIRDHSILKGESMGIVEADFHNRKLNEVRAHHRIQFKNLVEIDKENTLGNFIRNSESKMERDEKPFISFPIVSACPFSCIYCGQGGENTISPVSTMKIETIMDISVYLKRRGIKKVRLTGGEPLCHPQIGDIIRFFSESNFYTLINTNGLLVEEKVDSLIRTASNIHFAVSLDTVDPVKFDKISRTIGNFEKVIRGIRILKEFGYLMRINMVVGKFNINEVKDMINFCREIGCDLKLQEVASVPYPNSEWEDIHEDLNTLEKEFSKIADRVLVHDYARNFGIPVKIFEINGVMVTLKSMDVGSRYDIDGICKDCPHLLCHEGLYDIYVLADGSIATCRWCRFGGIDTFEDDLDSAIKIFQNAQYLGVHQLKKMSRFERSDGGMQRL